jgi:hypothetical protein
MAGSAVPEEVNASDLAKAALFACVSILACGCSAGRAGDGTAAHDGASDSDAPEGTVIDMGSVACVGDASDSLDCGVDGCGNAMLPECVGGHWVCPIIPKQPSCNGDASADAQSLGVACGSGACRPGMLCELQPANVSWACVEYPSGCPAGQAEQSEQPDAAAGAWMTICDCLSSNAIMQGGCPFPSCGPLDGGFVVGCIAK